MEGREHLSSILNSSYKISFDRFLYLYDLMYFFRMQTMELALGFLGALIDLTAAAKCCLGSGSGGLEFCFLANLARSQEPANLKTGGL